jgi:predicted amidohydrolase
LVTISALQMRFSDSKQTNLKKAGKMIESASRKGVEIVCLPEYFSTGGRADSFFFGEPIPGHTTDFLSQLAKKNRIWIVGGSILERSESKTYNTSIVIDEDGSIVGKYRKTHLWLDEHYIKPGNEYPVFEVCQHKIGIMICWDIVFPEVARILRLKGAEIIFCPSSPTDRAFTVFKFCSIARAIENDIYFVLACPCGDIVIEAQNVRLLGHSLVAGPNGKIVSASYSERILTADLDLEQLKLGKENTRKIKGRKPWTYGMLSE